MTYFIMGFAVLLLVVVFLLVRGSLRDTVSITLPTSQADSTGGEQAGAPSSNLNVVTITPHTVQPAINTLSRPAAYSRKQVVELFWSGGSGKTESQVYVSGSRTRIDTLLPDGGTRHELVVGNSMAVWYDEETEWTVLHAEQFTADIARRMLSYETVRTLPVQEIVEADYRDLDGRSCIYVATREGRDGYANAYWVGVDTGLLLQAERLYRGEVVYRFTASDPAADPPADELFLLPDGSTPELAER